MATQPDLFHGMDALGQSRHDARTGEPRLGLENCSTVPVTSVSAAAHRTGASKAVVDVLASADHTAEGVSTIGAELLALAGDEDERALHPKRLHHLMSLASLSAELGAGKVKKGQKVGASVDWLAKRANIPSSSFYADDKLLEAASILARHHGTFNRTSPTEAARVLKQERLAKIKKLMDIIGDEPVRIGQLGLINVGWASAKLQIPPFAIYADRDLMEALQSHRARDTLFADTDQGVPGPQALWKQATTEEISDGLARMERFDSELEQRNLAEEGSGRVPAFGGKPAIGKVAARTGCRSHVLRDATVYARLLEISCRHGLVTDHRGPFRGTLISSRIKRSLKDHADTRALRGETFPIRPSGAACLSSTALAIGVSTDLVYKAWFRTEVNSHQRRLAAAVGMQMPVGAMLDAETTATVLDQFERDVASGAVTPIVTHSGEPRLEAQERFLGLVAGTCSRFGWVAARLLATVEPFGRTLVEEREAERERRRLDYLLSQFARLGDEMAETGDTVSIHRDGSVSMIALEAGLKAQLREFATHDMIVDAIDTLRARVGERVLDKTRPATSKGSRTVVDVRVDRHCLRIVGRGIPMSTELAHSDSALRSAISAELQVDAADLEERHLLQIKRAFQSARTGAPRPGSIHYDDPTKPMLKTALANPTFADGVPADPLDGSTWDSIALAKVSGLSPKSLINVECLRAPIRMKIAEVGLKPYAGDELGITFAQLEAWGRRLRRVEARGADSNPSRRAAAGVATLHHAMALLGKKADDVVATSLDVDMVEAITNPAELKELERWRVDLVRLVVHLTPDMDLATTLKLLHRALRSTPRKLVAKHALSKELLLWTTGKSEPSWGLEVQLQAVNDAFGLPLGYLSDRINADQRNQGARGGPERFNTPIYQHLPPYFWTYSSPERKKILNEIASEMAVQTDAKSRRRAVLNHDEYRLPWKRWPKHLKAEFREFLTLKDGNAQDANTDEDDLFADDEEVIGDKPLTSGGKNRYLGMFENLFGYLTLATSFTEPQRLIHPGTKDWRVEEATVIAEEVGYVRRPGLGVKPEMLTIGLLALWPLAEAFMRYKRNRAGHYDSEALNFANQCQVATRQNGLARNHPAAAARVERFLVWWETKQTEELRTSMPLPKSNNYRSTHETQCAVALSKYDSVYKKLKNRRGAKGPRRLQQGRDPFAPIEAVLASDTPVAIYRALVRDMKDNRPPLSRPRARHRHVRNCLVVMILLQTYLRVKNLAQLTYRPDGTGQLRFVDGTWWVKIHKARFKNQDGSYFRNGEFFELPLRDEDGLYGLLEEYLLKSREFLRLSKDHFHDRKRTDALCIGDDATSDPMRTGPQDPDDDGYEEDYQALEGDDEDDDDFGDHDPDGEPPEARLFQMVGGREFLPSQMAGLYRQISSRYLSQSRFRGRGLKGLQPHGPHAVRHIGATDALKTTHSWEKAAQVIHDSIAVTMKVYARWTPTDQGKIAARTMQQGRDCPPVFAAGHERIGAPLAPPSAAHQKQTGDRVPRRRGGTVQSRASGWKSGTRRKPG